MQHNRMLFPYEIFCVFEFKVLSIGKETIDTSLGSNTSLAFIYRPVCKTPIFQSSKYTAFLRLILNVIDYISYEIVLVQI